MNGHRMIPYDKNQPFLYYFFHVGMLNLDVCVWFPLLPHGGWSGLLSKWAKAYTEGWGGARFT